MSPFLDQVLKSSVVLGPLRGRRVLAAKDDMLIAAATRVPSKTFYFTLVALWPHLPQHSQVRIEPPTLELFVLILSWDLRLRLPS